MSCRLISYLKNILGNDLDLEERIGKLEEELQDLKQRCNGLQCEPEPQIIVEQLYVEKLMVDKIELNNNFGSLGIKDLGGTLNIGANYGGGVPLPKEKEKAREKEPKQSPSPPQSYKRKNQSKRGDGPICKISFK